MYSLNNIPQQPLLILLLIWVIISGCGNHHYPGTGLTIEETHKLNLSDSSLRTGWYATADSLQGFKRLEHSSGRVFYIDPKPILTAANFKNMSIQPEDWRDENTYFIALDFDEEGAKAWSEATLKASKRRDYLIFILSDTILSAPMVMAEMTKGKAAISTNTAQRNELKRIILKIASGK